MEKLLKLIAELEIAEKEFQRVQKIVSRKSKGKDIHYWVSIWKHYGQHEQYQKIQNLKQKINQLRQKHWYWK